MARFVFRLQKVLEHRRREADEGRREVGRARALLTEVEARLAELEVRSRASAITAKGDVTSRLGLQMYLEAIQAEVRSSEIERAGCEEDLSRARETLTFRMGELGAIEALEAKDHRAWLREEARGEQNALDEWATMRPRVARAA